MFGLDEKVIKVELRLSTSLMEISTSLENLTTVFSGHLDLRTRVDRCEQAIDELKQRPER